MPTLNLWAQQLSNSDLVEEFINLYSVVEIAECVNSKDFSRLLAVEQEIVNRGGDVSIHLPHMKLTITLGGGTDGKTEETP